MAGTTGLEPATSDVTGRRSNQLSYVPAMCRNFFILTRMTANPNRVWGRTSVSFSRLSAHFQPAIRNSPDTLDVQNAGPPCFRPNRLQFREKLRASGKLFRRRAEHAQEVGNLSRHCPETPFDNIESSHEYVSLLAEAIAEAIADVEADIALAKRDSADRRVEALQLVQFNLAKLNTNMAASRRVLNDLRTLRRLLLEERSLNVAWRSAAAD
jgi:hypothetical protein